MPSSSRSKESYCTATRANSVSARMRGVTVILHFVRICRLPSAADITSTVSRVLLNARTISAALDPLQPEDLTPSARGQLQQLPNRRPASLPTITLGERNGTCVILPNFG